MNKADLLQILNKLQSGETTSAQVADAMTRPVEGKKGGRGRPRKISDKSAQKRPKGRPKSEMRKENYLIAATFWVLFHDRIPKMTLRAVLSEALFLSDTSIGKIVARINTLAKHGYFIGRSEDGSKAIFLTPKEYAKGQFLESIGINPLSVLRTLKVPVSACSEPEKERL